MLSLETNISINKANRKIDIIKNYLNKCRDEFDSYENEIWTNNNLLLRKKGSILISLSGYDPLENLINALIPALWLNNYVYVKVSRKSPLCVSELLKDLNNLYPLNNKLNLLIIENPVLIDLIENNFFNFVYWTGSFQSAKLIEKVCIDNNIEFAFEGSGQDILYIDNSFDNWSFFNEILIQSLTEINGNNCNAIKIIAIDEDIYSKTILEIEKVIKSIKIQQNINDLNELSIGHQKDSNIENISKILDYFSKYKSISSFNNKSNLISPILYFDVNIDDIFKYEILGPIIFTFKSKDINEIIEMTRKSPFGLSLTLLSKKYFSKDLLKKFDISRLNINCNPLNV
jgi:acyl-CoA reductase-like NAD-dependent aldehyde dehydrogenase